MTFVGRVHAGSLSGRALLMVRECAALDCDELEADWSLAVDGRPLNLIDPLE